MRPEPAPPDAPAAKIISIPIGGMTCAACARTIERVVGRLDGVAEVSVNVATEKARVACDGKRVRLSAVKQAIANAGYEPFAAEAGAAGDRHQEDKRRAIRALWARFAVSAAASLLLLYLAMGPMLGLPVPLAPMDRPLAYALAQLVLVVPSVAAGYRFYAVGARALVRLAPKTDSLANRYRQHRLHPFSLRELNARPAASHVDVLPRFGGFPEPLFRQDEPEHRIWQRDRLARMVREDLRDLERVRKVSFVGLLVELLPERVGSPGIRAVKKERKLYPWDWSAVTDPGARFEHLVACHLLKYCHWIEGTEGFRMELRYLRDADRREVDFVVLRGGRPQFAVECKTGDRAISPAVRYCAERTPIPRFFQVHRGDRHYASGKVTVLPFTTFCTALELP